MAVHPDAVSGDFLPLVLSVARARCAGLESTSKVQSWKPRLARWSTTTLVVRNLRWHFILRRQLQAFIDASTLSLQLLSLSLYRYCPISFAQPSSQRHESLLQTGSKALLRQLLRWLLFLRQRPGMIATPLTHPSVYVWETSSAAYTLATEKLCKAYTPTSC